MTPIGVSDLCCGDRPSPRLGSLSSPELVLRGAFASCLAGSARPPRSPALGAQGAEVTPCASLASSGRSPGSSGCCPASPHVGCPCCTREWWGWGASPGLGLTVRRGSRAAPRVLCVAPGPGTRVSSLVRVLFGLGDLKGRCQVPGVSAAGLRLGPGWGPSTLRPAPPGRASASRHPF